MKYIDAPELKQNDKYKEFSDDLQVMLVFMSYYQNYNRCNLSDVIWTNNNEAVY